VDHPIGRAVRGLPLRLEWPIAIQTPDTAERTAGAPTSAEPGAGSTDSNTTATPIYTVDDPNVWAESQWLSYWQVRMAEHDLVPNKPARDSQRDLAAAAQTPVVVAAERRAPSGPQRLVVVGSNTWFMDRIAQERAMVDGRPVLTNPGNSELFEAAVYWLAGQDQMIAQSPTARAVPLIRPLGGGTLLLLRWGAIAGLPGLVLLAGLAWRLARG
jgi:hypothetical protein